ncbi:MAG: ABC transporter permease [Lachnospirales bacterium]
MNSKKNFLSKIEGDKLVLMGAILGVFVLFGSLNSNFLTTTNIVNLLVASSLVGLVSIGHTYLIIAGQNDLSPGSLAALSGVLAALFVSFGFPLIVAIILTLGVCIIVGCFNAFMVNKIKIEAFIATLVTQSIVRGFAYIVCDGKPVAISNSAFIELGKARFLNLPVTVWITIISFLVFGFILAKTKFGRSIYAIGGNKDAARLAGLNPKKVTLISFILMGVLCGIGGIIFAARMHSGQPASGVNLEFDAITAVILGGVSFTGGVGTMLGTALGVILIQAFNMGLTMVNVPSFWQYVARGCLLLFALTLDYLRKKNREKKLLEASKKNL